MGRHQVYKGDPTSKLYYVVDNFSGGINTIAVDEAIRDYEFRDLVNVDLGKQGLLSNRRGFKEIDLLTNILTHMNIAVGAISLPTDRASFVKILKNENNTLENIYKNVYSRTVVSDPSGELYSILEATKELTTEEVLDDDGLDLYIKSQVEDIWVAIKVNRYTAPDTYDVEYYYTAPKFSGNLELLIIAKSKIYKMNYVSVNDSAVTFYNPLIVTELKKEGKTLPIPISEDSYKTPITGVNCVEHLSKIYISLSDLISEFSGALVYDKDNSSWYIWDPSGTIDPDLVEDVYKPTPYEISSSIGQTVIDQGFNVMAQSPLTYIDDQKTGLPTIRSLFLTDTSTGAFLDKIPTSGDFTVNVIKTGSEKFKPENLQLFFRNETGEYLDFKVGTLPTGGVPNGVYGVDNGGYFSYVIQDLDTLTSSYILIDVKYQNKYFNKVDDPGLNGLELFNFNDVGKHYAVRDEQFLYLLVEDYTTGNGGRSLSDYDKIKIDYILEVSNVDAQEPAGKYLDDVEFFNIYMSADYDQKVFQFRDSSRHRAFKYVHSGHFFQELSTGSDGILYDTWQDFIPTNGKLISIPSFTDFYFYTRLPGFWTLNRVNKNDILGQEQAVPALEGQYYDIGTSSNSPVSGLNLKDVKLLVIDDKLVYYKGNTLYFSKLYQFDYVPNFSYVILPILSTDEIITVKYFRGSWIIFTREQIWRMKGTYGSADWELKLINDSIGCDAANSVRSIENSLYFLSERGLYKLIQNYYQDGLENVKRVDKNIIGMIPIDKDVSSLLYKGELILYTPNSTDFDAIRMYYDINLPEGLHPFVKDLFAVKPECLFMENGSLYSYQNSRFWKYDEGYTDFMPITSLTPVIEDNYTYDVAISLSNNNFGYAMHDKKYKHLYVKTFSEDPTMLYFTVWIDDNLRINPYSYRVTLNDEEEIEYEQYADLTKDNIINLELAKLGKLELGVSSLGDNRNKTHKILIGYKGKVIRVQIKQKSNGNFGITNFGYLYKLGKVKEQG